VIALLYGIKISAVHCLVLSQSTPVTDGRRDRQTELRQLDRASICSRGKHISGQCGYICTNRLINIHNFVSVPLRFPRTL